MTIQEARDHLLDCMIAQRGPNDEHCGEALRVFREHMAKQHAKFAEHGSSDVDAVATKKGGGK